ncbi:MAG: threonine/serine dehydratase [Pseudomonadota bacterium]
MTDWKTEIAVAARRIGPHIVRTPVMTSDSLWAGGEIQLKLEQLQHTGSFKARGAFNNLLTRKVPESGIVAASGGNHGAAAAFAAQRLGMKARIFVPELAGPAKIALIRRTGADLEVCQGVYADALDAAMAHEKSSGAIQLHAYDAQETVVGQGTTFSEWDDQGLDADTVLIAVGGGGLIAGAMAWFGRDKKIVAVEPETAATLNSALASGPETEVEVSGIAANALGARKIGNICYGLAREARLQSVLVSDAAIADARDQLWTCHRMLVEPAGAAGLAALSSGAYAPEPEERVAVLVCGANPAPDPLS